MNNLQELTGQESGIVIYDGRVGIVCNWSSINGYPRMFALGLMLIGLNEEIPQVEGVRNDSLAQVLDGVEVHCFSDTEELPETGTVYNISDAITVIAPDDWN